MAFKVQYIIINGKNLVKKRKQSLNNSGITLNITAQKF